MKPIRHLKPSEVTVRIQSVKSSGFTLLLYKDSRVDMQIMDETFGAMNWKREHTRDNHNCVVSVWNKEIGQWVSKEDTGTESYTEKEKGLASDSFKRACFNWGIGRELYTAPFIKLSDTKYIKDTGKKDRYNKPVFAVYEKFKVTELEVIEGKITRISIADSKGYQVFTWLADKDKQPPTPKNTKTTMNSKDWLRANWKDNEAAIRKTLDRLNKSSLKDLTLEEADKLVNYITN